MAFNTATFSTSGLSLLAQLSSTKSLRIKHIYIDETEHTSSDFNQPPSWWASQTSTTMAKVDAELSAASVISDQARLIVKLSLKQDQTTTVTAKTIVITACGVESGTESTEVTFCGISDATGIEAIYNASGVKVSTSAAIYFAFNSTSSITFADNINPDFVVHSELDRFVSCHPVGDPTGGEAQTVGGIKTFKDGAVINIADSSKLSFQFDGDEQGWIGDTGTAGLQFMSISPAVGDICFRFSDNDTAIVTISRNADSSHEYFLMDVDGNINVEGVSATTLRGTSVETNTCTIDGTTLARMSNGLSIDRSFAPTTDNTLHLGLPGNAWSQIYSYTINVSGSIDIASQKAQNNTLRITEDDGDLVLRGFLKGKGLYLGQMYDTATHQLGDKASFHCGDIYAKNAYASGDLTVAGTLHGVIPVPSSQTDIPVGSICVLRSSADTRRGDQFLKRPDGQGWLVRRTSSDAPSEESANVNLSLGDLADATAGLALVYSDYTQSTRFMALSHANANKSFLAIRTA